MTRILVIEDDRNYGRLLADNLEFDRFEVDVAADLPSAYQALDRLPKLILLDIMLGADDGLQFLRSVRLDTRFSGIPVILLTNLGGVDNRLAGMVAGADDYVEKTVDVRELIARVQMHLRRSERERFAVARDLVAPGGSSDKPTSLTRREREILAALARGWRTQDIAEALVMSPNTVRTHVDNLFEKLGVRSRIEAVNVGLRLGLIEAPRAVPPAPETA